MKNSKKLKTVIGLAFILTAGVIVFLLGNSAGIFRGRGGEARQAPLMLLPRQDRGGPDGEVPEIPVREEARALLSGGEVAAAVLSIDLGGDFQDGQILASRAGSGPESPVMISCIARDPVRGDYRRFWSLSTPVTRPGTVSLSVQDIIGDRSTCIVLSGLDGAGRHTLTMLRQDAGVPLTEAWRTIADVRVDGTISIREAERSQAYRMGQAPGQSHSIISWGRDPASSNILDRLEITWRYSPARRIFIESGRVRVPGSQVEQRRLRELLSGRAAEFEEFISGLWYYVSPQGTLDSRQYLYFDPRNRELVFYVDETQQVFSWAASSVTRYGLYISSHNVSVTTLRRSIDIELESLSAIRIRVYEDVRLPISVNDSWDGSYRRADAAPAAVSGSAGEAGKEAPEAWLDAVYDGAAGKLTLGATGEYGLDTGTEIRRGNYAFFRLDGRTFLEFRPGIGRAAGGRDTWLVGRPESGTLVLSRVLPGTGGIEILQEPSLTLTRE